MLEDFGFEEVGLLDADGAPYRFAILEEDEGRHRTYTVACCQFGILVDVDFDDGSGITDLLFHFFENGALHLAGATPGCEKVDQCRL